MTLGGGVVDVGFLGIRRVCCSILRTSEQGLRRVRSLAETDPFAVAQALPVESVDR